MRRRLLAALAAVAMLAGCADATAEAEISTPVVPPDPQLIQQAQEVLADTPPPPDGHLTGVIVTEGTGDRWGIGVLNADGAMTYLTYDWCDEDGYARDVLPVLLDIGDLIVWTTTDEKVCIREIWVEQKAAAALDGDSDE